MMAPGAAVVVLGALLMVSIPLAISVGAVPIPLRTTCGLLMGGVGSHPTVEVRAEQMILFDIRLPRALCAAVIGAALSIGGLLYQGLFRNPMAEPYVIGSSGGAALGAMLSFIIPRVALFGFSGTATMAFACSMATVLAVYAIARVNGRISVVSLLLAGLAFSAILTSATSFLASVDRDGATAMRLLTLWLSGAVATPTYGQLLAASAVLLICLVISVPMARQLNTLALGDEQAQSLGIPLEWTRAGIIVLGSLLTAVAVSLGGIIGFVGLIVPHFLRLLFGPDHRRLLPLCALGGAIFLLAADTLARTALAPAELPVGVLTAFIGVRHFSTCFAGASGNGWHERRHRGGRSLLQLERESGGEGLVIQAVSG